MATPRRAPLASLCLLLFFAAAANALHFYLDTNEKRCFIEELPTDTVVEGMCYVAPRPVRCPVNVSISSLLHRTLRGT